MGTATAIGYSALRKATAAEKPQTMKRKPRGNHESKKIGPVGEQPMGNASAFAQLRRRMPGWRCDTLDRLFDEEYFYPEQLLRVKSGMYDPFGHVNPTADILKEPPPAPASSNPNDVQAWQAQWLVFNTWVLGAPLNTTNPSTFDQFLAEIGKRVRRYNAALYWMRRLHFHENDQPISKPPAYNEHGDKQKDLPDLSTTQGKKDFQTLVDNAINEWEGAVQALNEILAGEGQWAGTEFESTGADMIEVNGYIVSMRIISKIEDDGDSVRGRHPPAHMMEVGGSSSSHISISSAFSSS